ncbi:MAG TPA: ATP-binding protein [Desulfomicrobiaceae bacterium]|nr:ATP-binding protein [Desulfomicrobiaceae bacterium]
MPALPGRALGIYLTLGLALVIASWATLDISLRERDTLLDIARLRTQHQAELLSEHANSLLQSVDLVLTSRTDQWRRLLHDTLRQAPTAAPEPLFLPVLANVILLDQSGHFVAETNPAGPRISPANSPFFSQHKDSWVDFFLGRLPNRTRIKAPWIMLSHRIDSDTGDFLGVVAAILDPKTFTRRYTEFDPVTLDGLGLYDIHGKLLLHWMTTDPPAPHATLPRITDLGLFNTFPMSDYLDQGGLRTMETEGVLVTDNQLETFPLHMAVALDKSRILIPWQTRLMHRMAILFTAGLALFIGAAITLTQSRKKREAELNLIRSNEQYSLYRNMFEKNPAIKLLIDPESGQIIDANPAALRFYGHPREDLLSLKIWDVNTLSRESVRTFIGRALTGTASARQFTHNLADGTARDVEVYSGPVELGEKTFLYSIIHDTTDRIRYEKELMAAKSVAEKASRAKGEFLANMSHEIRTPLNGILGMLQLLGTTPMSSEQQEYVNTGLDSGQGLLSVINDILDLSKVDAGRLELHPAPFHISRMVRSLHAIFGPQAELKGLTLECIRSSDFPDLVFGDEARLRQILFNLLGNALKFTDFGSVTLEVSGTQTVPGEIALTFSVRDTGPGIAPELQQTIFDPFTQVDGSSARRHQGTGLGLNIVKRLLTLMNGSIQVRSTPGHGAVFDVSLTLPLTSQEPAPKMQAGTSDTPSLHILLVEDNKVNQMLARKLLTKGGHTVQSANNGRLALEALAAERFDCVLMDIQMPEMDGEEATRQIRSGAYKVLQPDIPIIAMTAHALGGDRERFLAAGMNDHLPKPVMIDALQGILATIVPREDVREKVDSKEK